LAGYEFDRTPEEVAAALRALDAMMGEWPFDQLGYVFSVYGAGNPEQPSGIEQWALNAVSLSLALKLAPGMGSAMSPDAKQALGRSMTLLTSKVSLVPSVAIPAGTVRGSGFPHWWSPYTVTETVE
jgi:hypothetical protein